MDFNKAGGRKMTIFLIASIFLFLITLLGMLGGLETGIFYKVLEVWKWITGFVIAGNAAEHFANNKKGDKQ